MALTTTRTSSRFGKTGRLISLSGLAVATALAAQTPVFTASAEAGQYRGHGGGDCKVIKGPGTYQGIATGRHVAAENNSGFGTYHFVGCFQSAAACQSWLRSVPSRLRHHDSTAASYCRARG
ncbi:MAG: hypothetical protein AAF468_15950 [Pseudomonadota bacterium]